MTEFNYSYRPTFSNWKQKLIYWAKSNYQFLALFQGNNYSFPEDPFQDLFFAGNQELAEDDLWNDQFSKPKIGIIGYDYKNQIEQLQSKNPTWIELPDLCFFTPDIAFQLDGNFVKSKSKLPTGFWEIIEKFDLRIGRIKSVVHPLTSKKQYIDSVRKIQDLIREGETYEMNFCQTYEGTFKDFDPINAFFELQKTSPMPFASLFKAKNTWVVSASPERYIKKSKLNLVGQPIKGTIRRGNTKIEDEQNRKQLLASEKERAENLMITDLTRNDLSKVSEIGSVKVDELFGIYALPRIFQMITTVSSTLKQNTSFKEIIQSTFPMGSMTGAPKIRTMELIDELESFKRGWFSGALGWIDENGNFDFSVVIRSIIADLEAKKLYFGVGSAITIDSDASLEYEECELKSQAIREVLNGRTNN